MRRGAVGSPTSPGNPFVACRLLYSAGQGKLPDQVLVVNSGPKGVLGPLYGLDEGVHQPPSASQTFVLKMFFF